MQRRILPLMLIALLASCAMQETRIYSLYMPPSPLREREKGPSVDTNLKPDATIAVIVGAPRYLTQPYIAYRSSPYQLSISKYAKWDSSPDEIIQSAIRGGLSSTGLFRDVRPSHIVLNGFYALKIDLMRFERSDEGDLSFAEVAFAVSLVAPEGKNLYQGSVTKKVKLDDRSFLSLARGLSSGLGEGIAEVKRAIEKTLRQ
ncbi:MAG TPA: ABC-type transport auxiliary lipoprotein family protein [Thermodesulfovibrionales bacterium]|nr:ABC-type transport auxiliary lipoprotein family protein [Thermodesulfovibrionales bacterium]